MKILDCRRTVYLRVVPREALAKLQNSFNECLVTLRIRPLRCILSNYLADTALTCIAFTNYLSPSSEH